MTFLSECDLSIQYKAQADSTSVWLRRKTFTLLTFYHYILLAICIVNILTGNRKFDVSCVKGELKSKEDYTQEKDMKFLGGMEDHCAFTGYVRGS